MAPLLLAGFGIGFVLVVIRTHGIDVVPDSIGLGLYAVGMWRLASRSRLFVVASALSGMGAVVALLDFVPNALPDALATAVVFGYNACVAACLAVGAWALKGVARQAEDKVARQLLTIAILATVGLAALVGGWAAYPGSEQVASAILGFGQLVNVVVMIWYGVLLVRCSPRDWAQPPSTTTPHAVAPRG